MRTKISIIAISILLLSVTACNSNDVASSGNPGAESTIVAESPDGSQNNGNQNGEGSFGQMQGELADISGEVSSISGNQITLKLIEMPSFDRSNRPPQSDVNAAGESKVANNSADDSTTSDNSTSDTKVPRSRNNEQRPQMSTNFTGESKTIIITDGVTITSARRGNGESNQETLSVADIKQGNILQIWYSDEAKDTISKISIMQTMNRNANPQGEK